MLANEELDVVDVTTGGYENGSWHFEPAMEALAAGKHVLCEKPLSNDIGEAREMVRYAAEKKLYLGCNLNHYFTPTAERAKKYMDDGQDRRDDLPAVQDGLQRRRGDLRASTSRRASTSPTRT